MARWLPIFAWCLCATSVVFLVILNIAGTTVVHGPSHAHTDHVLLDRYAPLSVTLPFKQVYNGSKSTTVRIFLNNGCVTHTPYTDNEDSPVCLHAAVGRAVHLEDLVVMAWGKANSGYWYMNFSNVSVENVHARPFDGVVVPFVFYILGMAEMILMLVSIPMVFCAENFAVVFHTTISLSAFLSIMIGNAILIAMARSRIHEMQHNSSRPYIEDAKVTSGFLGAGWGAAFAALLAGVLLLVDWRYEVKLTGRRWREPVRVKRRVRRDRNRIRSRGAPDWRAATALRDRPTGNFPPPGSTTISQEQLPSNQEAQRQI